MVWEVVGIVKQWAVDKEREQWLPFEFARLTE